MRRMRRCNGGRTSASKVDNPRRWRLAIAAENPMKSLVEKVRITMAALAVAVVALGIALPAAAQSATPTRAKVVLQMSDGDPAKWNLALNNARNIQADLGAANVDVELVAYGPGIGMLKADSVVANRIDEALGAGVKVVACENTMHGQKLTKADMLGRIDYVPAGVVAIMQRQQQGWAYIRP
jgi:intracellular sulfur oxidation DsrE/DsrF family protein